MGIVCKKHDFVGKRGTQFGEQNLLYILQKQTIFLNQKAGADDFTVFLVAAALMIQLVIAALMV